MKIDFVQEIVEDAAPPRIAGCLTGWEAIVFEVEDDKSLPGAGYPLPGPGPAGNR